MLKSIESVARPVESFFSHDQVNETKAASPKNRNGLTLLIINKALKLRFLSEIQNPFYFKLLIVKITNAIYGF